MMKRRKFGEYAMGGAVTGSEFGKEANDLPPITGAPMPNMGMQNKGLGEVFPEKDDSTPKQYSANQSAIKRFKQMPGQSPLGPATPALTTRPQTRPQAAPQQRQPEAEGDQWMNQLWQGLTINQGQGIQGYADGGLVSGMDLYNQTMQELESGGIEGYAQGGMVDQSREIAAKGRYGDTMLMHINPVELEGLQSILGPLTTNPDTGNPEAFLPLLAAAPAVVAATTAAAAAAPVVATGITAGAALAASATLPAALSTAGAASAFAPLGGMLAASPAFGAGAVGSTLAPAAAATAIPSGLATATGASAFSPFVSGGSGLGSLGSVSPTVSGAPSVASALSTPGAQAAFNPLSSMGQSAAPKGIGMGKIAKGAASALSSLNSMTGSKEEPPPSSPPPAYKAPPRNMSPPRLPGAGQRDRLAQRSGGILSANNGRGSIGNSLSSSEQMRSASRKNRINKRRRGGMRYGA